MIVIRAARLIDGTGGPAIDDALVVVEGSRISFAGPETAAPVLPPDTRVIDLGSGTIMPGLIDCHGHPGWDISERPQPPATWADQLLVLAAAATLQHVLGSGITTMRVPGSPRATGYALRAAAVEGLIAGPRLIMAGPVICSTGGHGYSMGAEADGPDGVRAMARRLFRDGSDFLKLTATGGGTPGTVRHRATFTVEELAAAAEEAERHDSYATAHVHGTEGIVRCLDAGIQMLEHATFVGPDNREQFDRAVAERIRDQQVPVVPTVQVYGRWLERTPAPAPDASEEERRQWAHRSDSFERRLELVAQLHDVGVTLLMGSDGGGRTGPLDDLGYGLALHVRAGIDPLRVICSATGDAAAHLGIGEVTGTVHVGLEADLLGVAGNPIADITTIGQPLLVLRGGIPIREPALAPAPQP